MPDATLSAALKEAYATAPSGVVLLHTLEFRHSAFTAPIRVVLDYVDHVLTLEATAPVNPSTAVTFQAFAFDLMLPPMLEGGVPEMEIRIDNVDRQIIANIELAMATFEVIEVTYRPYLSTVTTTPQMNPPMTFQVKSIEADTFSITARCGFGDVANKQFPAQVYTTTRFRGLSV
jgi:hypothetical protein